jgi:hypothetical protein
MYYIHKSQNARVKPVNRLSISTKILGNPVQIVGPQCHLLPLVCLPSGMKFLLADEDSHKMIDLFLTPHQHMKLPRSDNRKGVCFFATATDMASSMGLWTHPGIREPDADSRLIYPSDCEYLHRRRRKEPGIFHRFRMSPDDASLWRRANTSVSEPVQILRLDPDSALHEPSSTSDDMLT